MKKIGHIALGLILTCVAFNASAQLKTAYFMEGSIPRYEMNVALTPLDGFVGVVPFSNNFQLNFNNNFISLSNFLYPQKDGKFVTFMHPSISPDRFLKRLPEQPNIGVDFKYSLLSFGKYHKHHGYFWSFDLNFRSMTDVTLSKDLFRILKDTKNGTYDLGKTSISTMNYFEMSYGFTMPTGWNNLVIGGRLKFLMGVAHMQFNLNKGSITITENNAFIRAGGSMQASITGMDYTNIGQKGQPVPFNDIVSTDNFALKNIGRSFGAAIDLGAEMSFFNKHLKVSLGVNDLGFIYWGKRNSIEGKVNDILLEYHGWNIDEGKIDYATPGKVSINKTETNGYAKQLATTLNVGAEWSFGQKRWASIGVLSHTKFWNKAVHSELTVIGTLRGGKWFSWAISHTFLQHNKFGIFGSAINFHPKAVNIFLGVDYIPTTFGKLQGKLVPTTMKAFNVYMGFSFTPKGRSKGW